MNHKSRDVSGNISLTLIKVTDSNYYRVIDKEISKENSLPLFLLELRDKL